MSEETRIERILTALLLQQLGHASQQTKIVVLSKAGLSNQEIAGWLDTSSAVVNQQLYLARTANGAGAKAKKSKSKKPKR